MSDQCANCDAPITEGGTFKAPNERYKPNMVRFINFINETESPEMCSKCGAHPYSKALETLDQKIAEQTLFVQDRIADFPMLTLSWLPANATVKLKNLITANVTVGTGLFSEFSQGFSDFTGAVNLSTGMSHKVNKGEGAARSILVNKAMALNANCILGVDVDYGITGNNAATINMQGTAAVISNLAEILDAEDFAKAEALQEALAKMAQLRRWRKGDISS